MRRIIKNKKASEVMGLSFSMIFSIIIIIFAVTIAFYVINSFLKSQKCTQMGIFIDSFKKEVNDDWNAQMKDSDFKGNLPSAIKYICFANLSKSMYGANEDIGFDISIFEDGKSNLFFYPTENACNMPNIEIKHLNIDKITTKNNPYCIPVKEGLVKIKIEKGFNEPLVRVS